MTDITVADLTLTTLDGTGVFDTLMRANKAHLEQEFSLGRIKGTEYATVYLGSLESVMRTSMEFLLQRQKISLEAQLMEQQILLAQVEVIKANAAVALVNAQIDNTIAELAIIQANATKIPAEIAQLTAQTALVTQQRLNTIDELLTSTAQRNKLTVETSNLTTQGTILTQQRTNLVAEALNIPKQGTQLDAQTALTTQQKTNLLAEATNIPKQGALIDAQALNTSKQADIATQEILVKQQQVLVAIAEVGIAQAKLVNIPKEGLQLTAQTALTTQQTTKLVLETLNVPKEGLILDAQKCKLDAEFDLLQTENVKANAEATLLTQKNATEKAQILAVGVDVDSVIGKQKQLYQSQSDGFKRDAEQKAAKLLVDTWTVRRTTDEGTVADGNNLLFDNTIGRVVGKLLTGVGA
jgi:hypothetical protein